MSLTTTDLAATFNKTTTDITWGITLVLMFRSVGSIIFGIAADRYGRKWPFIVNNMLFIALELVSVGWMCSSPSVQLALDVIYFPAGGVPSNAIVDSSIALAPWYLLAVGHEPPIFPSFSLTLRPCYSTTYLPHLLTLVSRGLSSGNRVLQHV